MLSPLSRFFLVRSTALLATLILSLLLPTANLRAAAEPQPRVTLDPAGLRMESHGGDYELGLHLFFQPRGILQASGDPSAASQADRYEGSGFRVRRMQFILGGVFASLLDYRMQLETRNLLNFTDGNLEDQTAQGTLLYDAWVNLRPCDLLQLQAGQFKAPYSGQWLTPARSLLFPERAITHAGFSYSPYGSVAGFSLGRDIGFMLKGKAPRSLVQYQAALLGGDGYNTWPADDSGLLVMGRLVFNPLGPFKADEFDLKHGPPRLSLGVSANRNHEPRYDSAGDKQATLTDTRMGGELRFAARGLTIASEFYLASANSADSTDRFSQRTGFYVQGGYTISPLHLTPGLRFALLDPDLGADLDSVYMMEFAINYSLPQPGPTADDLGHATRVLLAYGQARAQDESQALFQQVTTGLQLSF